MIKSRSVLNKNHYKVTCVVYVEAKSERHAAHVAKGVMQMKEGGPENFIVEQRTMEYGTPYSVDLGKDQGERGYLEPASGF